MGADRFFYGWTWSVRGLSYREDGTVVGEERAWGYAVVVVFIGLGVFFI